VVIAPAGAICNVEAATFRRRRTTGRR
jgi:hypothetical protein